LPRKLSKLLVLKNADAFVESSNHLPPIHKRMVQCKTPKTIRVLNGIVDRNIMECLNADDVQGAINFVNPQNKGTEDNIIDVLIQKYNKTITNLALKLQYTEAYIYDTPQDKEAEINRITSKIKETEARVEMIKGRIREADVCYICYEDINNKTITKCCQNSFCFKCINLWLDRKSVCPLCKTNMTSKDILCVLDQQTGEACGEVEVEMEAPDDELSDQHDKCKNVSILLRKRQAGSKFLIFSNFDTSFVPLYPVLGELQVKYAHLKGNANVIKCMVEKYRNGDIDVLLVNSRHYGSGLNLENTTDVVMFHKFDTEIEKQVVGRAHRMGRTCPLNVWYFLYENEMATSN